MFLKGKPVQGFISRKIDLTTFCTGISTSKIWIVINKKYCCFGLFQCQSRGSSHFFKNRHAPKIGFLRFSRKIWLYLEKYINGNKFFS